MDTRGHPSAGLYAAAGTCWKSVAAGIALWVAGSLSAGAQPAPTTLLHLSATSTVSVTPAQLVAEMQAQASSASAVDAQHRLNALMADAMGIARGESGVEARAAAYSVAPTDNKRTTWVATQVLELRGTDDGKVFEVAGRLQDRGLIITSLAWQLSPEQQRQAHDAATLSALKMIRARADAAAQALDLRFDHLQDVRLNDRTFPQPRMAAMAVQGAPPPQATRAPEDVTAEVSADVVLVAAGGK